MELKNSETLKNLCFAFLNESQSSLVYTYYAKAIKKEGYEPVFRLLTELSIQIQSQAKRFFRLIDTMTANCNGEFGFHPISDTVSNLEFLAEQENMNSELYESMAQTATEEGFKEATAVFKLIAGIKKEYLRLLTDYLSDIENDSLYNSEVPIHWRCLKCGHIHQGTHPPEKCPACLHPGTYFEPVND